MYRGTTLFRCNECGKLFIAPDFEYMATFFSVPQPCTRCGSMHTYPFPKGSRSVYRNIWVAMDKEHNE